MSEKDYYPLGAYKDPSAPYNQVKPKEKAFKCEVVETIRRDVDVFTSNYSEYYERDEDGFGFHEIETDNVDWGDEYEAQYGSLQELFNKVKTFLTKHVNPSHINKKGLLLYNQILEQCEGWEFVERDVDHIE